MRVRKKERESKMRVRERERKRELQLILFFATVGIVYEATMNFRIDHLLKCE